MERAQPEQAGPAEPAQAAELALLFELSLDLLCIADIQGRFVRLNRAWETTLGYAPQELEGRPFIDFVHPDDAPQTLAVFTDRAVGVPGSGFVNRYRCKDGTYRWLEWRASPFHGRFVYAVARDVTERKRSEQERQAHLRFLEGLECFNEAIRRTPDLEHMMDAALSAALSIFGSDRAWLLYPCDPDALSWCVPKERTRPEFPGAFAQGAVIPMRPEAAAVFRAALATDGPLAYDSRSGRPMPPELAERFCIRSQVLMAVHPKLRAPWVFGMHQCSHARVWTDEDIRTFNAIGRRLADGLGSMLLLEDLRRSEEKHKFLIEATHTGYVILDGQGRVTDANQEYVRLAAHGGLEEIQGRNTMEWTAEHDRARAVEALRQCVESGSVRNLELDYAGADGRITPVEINASVLMTTGVMAICRDITERKRVEAEMREAARRKDQFLAMLSHELRNPLTAIHHSLLILDQSAPGEEPSLRARAVIGRQLSHLTRLIDDLLDQTRIARGKIRIQQEGLELAESVRRAAGDQTALFAANGVELELRLPTEPLWALADPARIDQVVGNLLQNAAKFTPRGGRVWLTLEREGTTATVTVRDTGLGIAPQFVGELFEPFSQADTTLDRSRGGLGLGLALVKAIVELHGGSVTGTSAGPGQGATFAVKLPVLTGPPAASRVRPQAQAPRRRVLVIEDNCDAADSLRDVLQLARHQVVVAYDGPQGIRMAREFLPEVVLCDIGLPGMDGYAVARALRSESRLRGAYLVAVSGYALPDDVRRATEAGFDAHLAKPLAPQSIEQALAGVGRPATPRPR